jgi:hypothetical protein
MREQFIHNCCRWLQRVYVNLHLASWTGYPYNVSKSGVVTLTRCAGNKVTFIANLLNRLPV